MTRLPTDEEKTATVEVLKDIAQLLKVGQFNLQGEFAQRLVRAQQWCSIMIGQMEPAAPPPELKVVEPEVVDGEA
jgi:hypothetical protein